MTASATAGESCRGRSRGGLLAVGAAALIVVGSVAAQERMPSRVFRTSAAAVAVDVVVRDRDGGPVTGLGPQDFELFEDGMRQTITTFDAVDLPSPASPAPLRAPGATSPNVTRSNESLDQDMGGIAALVFEELGPEARQTAGRAATQFIRELLGPRDRVAIFVVGRALYPVLELTSDKAALVRGIAQAVVTPGRPTSQAGDVPGAEFGDAAPGQRDVATAQESPYFRGNATILSLQALVDRMARFNGRKTIVVFSQGLATGEDPDFGAKDDWLRDDRRERFLRLLDRANRSQIAFYTFDAAGLRAQAPSAAARRGALFASRFGGEPYIALKMMADETGGRFVEATNDLSTGMRRLADDLRHYYLLGYTPTNTAADGSTRTLRVKVLRKGVTVRHRRSYRAAGPVP